MSRILVALTLGLLSSAHAARASDFIVTRYDDPPPLGCLAHDCSLREAVIAANAASGCQGRDQIDLTLPARALLTGSPSEHRQAPVHPLQVVAFRIVDPCVGGEGPECPAEDTRVDRADLFVSEALALAKGDE